jgi:dUTP pyrophosphatase
LKVRDVKSPERGTAEAAGIDFYVPNYDPEFIVALLDKNRFIQYDDNYAENTFDIILRPGDRVLIPSGIKTWMEPGTALIAANKSGVASKKGLIFGAQVVDSDYAGEVHINVINTSNKDVKISSGDKLIQFIHTPVLLSPVEEVSETEFTALHESSTRGEGGFGSTGTK